MNVLVTGSNRGLGLEWVKQLAARGDTVFATCRTPDDASELQAIADAHPDLVHIVAMDTSDEASIAAAKAAVAEKTNSLDALVNNAGINYGDESLDTLDGDNFLHTMKVNVLGPAFVVRDFLDLLKAKDGAKVINLSSGVGSLTNWKSDSMYSYPISKAALNMLTNITNVALKDEGIIIIVMDPGHVKTDMGGDHAPLEAPESIGGMIKVLDGLTPDDSGKYYHYTGSEIPW